MVGFFLGAPVSICTDNPSVPGCPSDCFKIWADEGRRSGWHRNTAYRHMLFPTLIFSIAIVSREVVPGFLVHSIFAWYLATSLIACAATGASQMRATGLDMDADVVAVGLLRIMHLVTIVLLMPSLIAYLITEGNVHL